ncbi:MAG: T9SS type A sorting domain-containing protein [Niastella sp.]|uniref:T9SS type A sorting domain-containing protein n=1 Tax=Niastella sp. TaxID=1869183 RepID=UPI00389B365F
MKPNFYTLVVLAIVLPLSAAIHAQNSSHDISSDWYNQALKSIQQFESQIKPVSKAGDFSAINMPGHTGFYISPDGYKVTPMEKRNWEVSFNLKGIGRSSIQWTPDQTCAVTHTPNELSYQFNNVAVQYINNGDGLRQNFLVNRKMPGSGALTVTIEPATELQPRLLGSNSLAFFNAADKMILTYEDLQVWDVNHKPLPAAMHFNNGLLTIEVNDSQAAYPVTIDPLNKTPEWNTSADGLISGLTSLQINASLYGYAVTGLGDVNGDGYGDAAISAPALTNIISGNGALASVGAVFVFYGSPTGLSTTPAKTLQPNTAVAGALFGVSVDGGDVTGDGINDIIVGAPLDSYSATTGGLINTATVKAGKVYIYPGGNTAVTNPTNFLEIKLDGSAFFSTGIAGIGSNVSVNALFGFSVAATGDLDGDNRSDIVVGAPGYLSPGVGAVQSGAAFVYHSGNLSAAPVQLQTPSASLLGLVQFPLLSHSGLLFGFSVDGAGDFNNDGKPDVIVGAPAGIDLSSLGGLLNGQVLGGTAHIYYGTGSGVNNTIGTTLQSGSGSLLSNAANLFGYKVRGLKNLNGLRSGSIAVGAPLGGLLPNALSLTIQSGNVHIFKKKTSPPGASLTSDQVLESPRSTSLLNILNSLQLNVLFGAAVDNAYDVNCDGYADLVVGEPLSSGATLPQLQANAVGGAAYVFLGNSGGTYAATPQYTASVSLGSEFLSVNAVSLFGYSVAGVADTHGPGTAARILTGSPAAALDFDNGLLNLGSTLGLLYNFTAGDNGPGKSFLFNTNLCNSTTLPITLIEFKGQEKDATTISLSWKTSNEINFNRFEVEKSRDGLHFESIGLVFPWEDAYHIAYAFNDKNVHPGANYYRLKMIDNDAAYKYSNTLIFSVAETAGAGIAIAPNPMVDKINVQLTGLSENTYRMELSSVTGQKFIEKTFNITRYSQTEYLMRTVSMTPGIYFLTVYDKNFRKVASGRVIVL